MKKADFFMTQLIYSYYSGGHKFPSIVSKNIMLECFENFIHKYSYRAGALKLWEQNLHYFVHLYSVSYNSLKTVMLYKTFMIFNINAYIRPKLTIHQI